MFTGVYKHAYLTYFTMQYYSSLVYTAVLHPAVSTAVCHKSQSSTLHYITLVIWFKLVTNKYIC